MTGPLVTGPVVTGLLRSPGRRSAGWTVPIGMGLLGVATVASMAIGVSDLDVVGVVRADPDALRLLLVSRLPRAVAILLAGAGAGVAGMIMQHLARNRFVAPSTAGTIESAGLGIVVATLAFTGASLMVKMVVAVAFAMAGTAILLALLRRLELRDTLMIPLVGLLFGGVVRSVATFLAYRLDLLQSLGAWTNGDFSGVLRGRYELLWLVAGAVLLAYLWADRFTVAGMGEEMATNLGLSHRRVVATGLFVVAAVTGIVVVVVGAIPFLGLVVPNLVSLWRGDNLRSSLPLVALSGAGFVLVCDVIGRVVRYPYEVPVGTVVGVVGSVVFLALVLRRPVRVGG